MLSRLSRSGCVVAAFVFVLIARLCTAQPHPVTIDSLGKGTVPLHGPWQFHLGDDPAWAAPGFDDSAWKQLSADLPWGEQGYSGVTGFAWYRLHVALTPASGLPQEFSLLAPRVADAYEVYWNGVLIGRNGALSPHPVWYHSQPAQTFPLHAAQAGVLAIRVWKAPLLSDDSGQRGGFEAVPEIGSPHAIANAKAALEYQWLRSRQFLFGENLLYAAIALLSGLAWWRNRNRWVLLWMTGFAAIPPANLLLLNAHLHVSYVLALAAAQPLSSIQDISLWFLLLWLLQLHEDFALRRLTQILAWIGVANATIDGALVALSRSPQWLPLARSADAVSALLNTLLEVFPLVLVVSAVIQRKRLDSTRRLIAGLAFLDEMIFVFRHTVKQGRQFTHWAIASRIDAPLFTVGGSAITLYTLTGALLLLAMVYAVYSSVREDQRRQEALEREKAELLRTHEQMRHHAEHDGLTGLWNHRIIMERLRGEMDRSRREGTPLSVVLADIDHFKSINDSFGHSAGDKVLKEISAIFVHSVRSYDWVGRYGGEEFLLVLPGSDFESACARAEQLRAAVHTARIQHDGLSLKVTSSFGVTSGFCDLEPEAVIRIVDQALYRAKDNGRNCVIAMDAAVPAGEA